MFLFGEDALGLLGGFVGLGNTHFCLLCLGISASGVFAQGVEFFYQLPLLAFIARRQCGERLVLLLEILLTFF